MSNVKKGLIAVGVLFGLIFVLGIAATMSAISNMERVEVTTSHYLPSAGMIQVAPFEDAIIEEVYPDVGPYPRWARSTIRAGYMRSRLTGPGPAADIVFRVTTFPTNERGVYQHELLIQIINRGGTDTGITHIYWEALVKYTNNESRLSSRTFSAMTTAAFHKAPQKGKGPRNRKEFVILAPPPN